MLGWDRSVVIAVLTVLSGGTSPTVTVTPQLSHDNVNWVTAPFTTASAFTTTGMKTFSEQPSASETVRSLPWAKYIRFKAVGGGTAPPTGWTLTCGFQVAKTETASRVIGSLGTIAANGVGTVKQTAGAVELPVHSGSDRVALLLTLSGLTGGSSPTVTPTIEGSVDGSNWKQLTYDAKFASSFSANGSQLASHSNVDEENYFWIALSLPWRYLRITGTGGGSTAPTAWTLTGTYLLVRR